MFPSWNILLNFSKKGVPESVHTAMQGAEPTTYYHVIVAGLKVESDLSTIYFLSAFFVE